MSHLDAEVEDRGWNSSAMSQLDVSENSGTVSVHTEVGPLPATLVVAWEKLRDQELRIRARPSDTPPLSLDVARGFIEAVHARQRSGQTVRVHRRQFLTYAGLPWRGELWLDDAHRLGPPSKFPDALIGPQVLQVDAMVDGIGSKGVLASFDKRLRELCIFLGAVLGGSFAIAKQERGWVYEHNDQYQIVDCHLGHVGYVEIGASSEFPKRGHASPIERRAVARPGLGPMGIFSDMRERWVPDDIESLWRSFLELSPQLREQFLQAGNARLIAQLMWPEQRTAYAAFLVVVCEALKPGGRKHKNANVYDVVESLSGPGEGMRLRELAVHPQKVRSDLFHRGDVLGDEMGSMLISNPFQDPSFDEMLSDLARLSRICLIEWLRCAGSYTLVLLPRDHSP